MPSSAEGSKARSRGQRALLPEAAAERDALREHLVSCAWGGFSAGLVGMTDIVLAKTLGAPGWQVTLLATLAPAANLTSFWWAGQVAGRDKGGFFLLSGAMMLLPLVVVAGLASSAWIILVNFVYAVSTALFITATNAVLQQRYPARRRARWFGWSASFTSLSAMLAVVLAGRLLEHREGAFPWLFAVAGLTGFASTYHLFRMERGAEGERGPMAWLGRGWRSLRRRMQPAPDERPPGVRASVALFRRILREHPGFVRFERSFMIYGFAFMGLLPILPLYVVRELKLSYVQLAATKGVWSQIGLILLSPWLGSMLAQARPLRFTGRTFLLLALYPALLLLSTWRGLPDRVSWVYAALFCYSVAMTGVNLAWNLGSMHFAGEQDASAFQGVHVALTGLRGLIAPGLGYALYRLFGSAAVFAFSTLLFLWAGWLMLRQDHAEVIGSAPVPPVPPGRA